MDVSDPMERALKREIPLLAYLVRELDTPRWHKFTVVSALDTYTWSYSRWLRGRTLHLRV